MAAPPKKTQKMQMAQTQKPTMTSMRMRRSAAAAEARSQEACEPHVLVDAV